MDSNTNCSGSNTNEKQQAKRVFQQKKEVNWEFKGDYCHGKKIAAIIWHLITKEEIYEDETGYKKEEIQKRKIVETEILSVDGPIK